MDLGERGLLPVRLFTKAVPWSSSPSLFAFPNQTAFTVAGWIGVLLSALALAGIADHYSTWFSMLVWGGLWVLYISFVNVGQTSTPLAGNRSYSKLASTPALAAVLFNHFAELVVPFGCFLPQPVSAIAGVITIAFQAPIFAGGNLSWLNALTMVLALSTAARCARHACARAGPSRSHRRSGRAGGGAEHPAGQIMNTVYNRFHLVGTYGAFGSITRPRYEIIVEGATDDVLTSATVWRAYDFRGKPGSLGRLPPQIAPYHLRLDWLMWFAALSSYEEHPWFVHFLAKLLEGDRSTLTLLDGNPFPDRPPRHVRALLYEYHFTAPDERARTGQWWTRTLVRPHLGPLSLATPGFRESLEQQGWTDFTIEPALTLR